MDVSFKGVKNVYVDSSVISKVRNYSQDMIGLYLTNDGKHRDLDNFSEILDAYGFHSKRDFVDFKIVNTEEASTSVFLNNKPFFKFSKFSKEWNMPYENLNKNKWKNFQLFFDLIKRVANENEPKILEDSYLNNIFKQLNHFNENIKSVLVQEFLAKCNKVHIEEHMKKIVGNLNKSLDDYLESDVKTFNPKIKEAFGMVFSSDQTESRNLYLSLESHEMKDLNEILTAHNYEKKGDYLNLILASDKASNEKTLMLNGKPIKLDETEFLEKLVNKISSYTKNKDSISLPYEYLDSTSMGKLYNHPEVSRGVSSAYYLCSDEKLAESGCKIEVLKNSNDIRDLIDEFSKHFKRIINGDKIN